ncbi:MAG: hypothetical protein ABIP45_11735 [Knoellia sp.]
MEWVALALLAVAVIVVTVLMATGRLDLPALAEPTSTTPPLELPSTITSTDVDQLSIGTTFYGYAPAEVDGALDARRDRLAEQERERAERGSAGPQSAEQIHSRPNEDGHVHPDP